MATTRLLTEAAEEWLDALRGQGLSTGTVNLYGITMKQFRSHAGDIYAKNITPQHVDKFFTAKPEWEPQTRRMKQSHLNLFFEWCRNRGYMSRNSDPLMGRRAPKVPKIERLRLTNSELNDALSIAPNPRDRMVVAILIFLLVRDSEARTIRWKDILWERDEVYVFRDKTDEDDHLPMSGNLRDELLLWKRELEKANGIVQPDWYVLPPMAPTATRNMKSGQWAVQKSTVYDPTRPLARLINQVKPVLIGLGHEDDMYRDGTHTLRRSGARELFEWLLTTEQADKALRIVQSMLGHATLAQTEHYIGLRRDRQARDLAIKGKRMYGDAMGVTNDADVIPFRKVSHGG